MPAFTAGDTTTIRMVAEQAKRALSEREDIAIEIECDARMTLQRCTVIDLRAVPAPNPTPNTAPNTSPNTAPNTAPNLAPNGPTWVLRGASDPLLKVPQIQENPG